MKPRRDSKETRNRILMTAMNLIRENGYEATRIDDICDRTGITKGAFFHHFKTKDTMGEAVAQFFSDFADQLFAKADYQMIEDPLARLFGYIDLREAILQGEVADYTCLLGTLVQEVHNSHPELRTACQEHIWSHARTLVPMIQAALDDRQIRGQDPLEIALFIQAVLQGGFILAKAQQSPEPVRSAISHLRRHFHCLFAGPGDPTQNPQRTIK